MTFLKPLVSQQGSLPRSDTVLQLLPANSKGRDFVIGDLHACTDALLRGLDVVKFDPKRDRVLSTGDLVDRGLGSIRALRLLREPWFHAVRGNHEDMLLRWGSNPSRTDVQVLRFILRNGGGWLYALTPSERNELEFDLLPRVSRLPRLIRVGAGAWAYQVVHAQAADAHGVPWTDDQLSDGRVLRSSSLLWGRQLFQRLELQDIQEPGSRLPFAYASPAMHRGLRLTYAGHNTVLRPVLFRSHLFIDCGVWATQASRHGAMHVVSNEEVFANLGVFSDTVPLR